MSSDKKALRQGMLARRDALDPEERIAMSLAMADAADAIPIEPGMTVAGYLPIRSEPDLRPLLSALRSRGAVLCLPVVLDRETIVFRRFDREGELVSAGFGTFGPGPEQPELDPDLLLVPLSAFDRVGNRLGYGAGHYDRAIVRLRAKGRAPRLIGAAFSCQEAEAVPVEAHDVPLAAILTENGLREFDRQV